MKLVPYTPAVGSLMYAMVATRPDISHAVGVISRFMRIVGVIMVDRIGMQLSMCSDI